MGFIQSARHSGRLSSWIARGRAAAMLPVWAAQLATGAKSFGDNPLIGSRRLNAWGLHAGRVALAHNLAARRRARLARHLSPEMLGAFARDGFIVVPDFLPRPDLAALLSDVRRFRGPAREMAQGDTITRRIALNPSNLAAMPGLGALIDRPDWQCILRYVGSFDAEPMFYLQTILTKALGGPADPQTDLHADAFHPSVKAWLFLTDVEDDAAPFTFVPGSHRLTPARLAWEKQMSLEARRAPDYRTRRGSFRIDPDRLEALGLPKPRRFAVKAGTLVVADMFGFHARGPSAGPGTRVEIWAYGRWSPFLPWARLMLWNVPALARRRADLFWRFGDLMEAVGLRRKVWRERPDAGAFPDDGGT
jgi:hypothetical protein